MSKLEGAVIIYDTLGTVIGDDFRIRPNLKESIDKFKSNGAKFFLTSSFSTERVEMYASLLGIDSVIDGAFGVSFHRTKSYQNIIKRLGMSAESARHKLLISGDRHPGDAGIDGYGNVFVYDPIGSKRDSLVMNDLVDRMFDTEDKSFVTGFNRFVNSDAEHLIIGDSKLFFLEEKIAVGVDSISPTIYIK